MTRRRAPRATATPGTPPPRPAGYVVVSVTLREEEYARLCTIAGFLSDQRGLDLTPQEVATIILRDGLERT